jgi:SpoVK/Ycf46/Vps4 family AAA+-type ATPase
VLGATNRPNDIDAAFLRRMPKRYSVPLPDAVQRLKILRLMLASSRLDASFKYEPLVARTEGCSGSDLKELCRAAAMQPVREYLRSGKGKAKVLSLKEAQKTRRIESGGAEEREKATVETRPIRNSDFFVVGESRCRGTLTIMAQPRRVSLAEGNSAVGTSAGAKKG